MVSLACYPLLPAHHDNCTWTRPPKKVVWCSCSILFWCPLRSWWCVSLHQYLLPIYGGTLDTCCIRWNWIVFSVPFFSPPNVVWRSSAHLTNYRSSYSASGKRSHCVMCTHVRELYVACDVMRYTETSQLILILSKCETRLSRKCKCHTSWISTHGTICVQITKGCFSSLMMVSAEDLVIDT